MNPVDRVIRGVDRVQRNNRVLGFAFGVVRKFGDDRGSALAAQLAYYGFVSLFPLMLVVVTVLGYVLHGNEDLQHDLIDSAVSEFPVIGTQLKNNVKALGGNGLALVIGLVASFWGALGVTQSAQHAMAEVWSVPERDRPGFFPRLARGILLFSALGLGVLATTAYASFGTETEGPISVLHLCVNMGLNVAIFIGAFRILTPTPVGTRQLVPGAVIAGLAWSLLQLIGTYLVSTQLRRTSEIYGFFALVLGLLWWLYLAAIITMYCAELNVVLAKRLWPRSLVRPPLTGPDRRALRVEAKAKERVPEQDIAVHFERPPPESPPDGDR